MPQTPKICTPIESTPTRPPFKARVEAAQNLLRERHPDLFGDDPKPLKIGIHRDLIERHPDLDFVGLKRALTLHCGRFVYLKALKPGAARLDLDGQPDGEVTEEQVEIARQRLDEMKATPAPTPVPTPPPSPPSAISGRPVLRLKPKASTVTVATVTRREVKP